MTDASAPPAGPRILAREDGATIAYRASPGAAPGVVFLPGFRSDMTGTKAVALEDFCRARGQAFLRFDYTGHGASSGAFTDGTIGEWCGDAIFALDRLSEGPQILVGSSMGGWIMLLVALARPDRVAGLVGIAPAPDFTEDLMWPQMDAATRGRLESEGVIYEPSDYSDEPTPITMRLIEDGRRRLVMRQPIPFTGPVRLLHGMKDPDVPWQTSLTLADQVASADVEITLIKEGDHRLSEPHDLARLALAVAEVSDRIGGGE